MITFGRDWTASLRGRRVHVVHPFDRSIQSQYAKRTLLFDNPDNLPDFDLITVRAVQNPAWTFQENAQTPSSVSRVDNEFLNWFEALAYMEQQVEAVEFDVALIGCGAYGFPLAAHVKRLGRKAMHLGGITQMLFGIKGDRWVQRTLGLSASGGNPDGGRQGRGKRDVLGLWPLRW